MSIAQEQQKVLRMAQERGEFVTDVDGFVYWWPTANPTAAGHLSSTQLRWLADELDSRNAAWQAKIAADPALTTVLQPGRWYTLHKLRGKHYRVQLVSLSHDRRYCTVRHEFETKECRCFVSALRPDVSP